MDAFHSTHPNAESLRAYSLGRLDDASALAVGRHIEQCPECRRLVAEMAPDTFLDKLRGVQAGPVMSASSAEIPAEARTDRGRSNVAQEAAGDQIAARPATGSEPTAGLAANPSGQQPETTLKDDSTLDHATHETSPAVSDSEQTGALDSSTGDGLQPGTRVQYFGDYELQKVLGEGGMGVVYKARQLSLNRLVALKMIKATRFASPDELRRFQNEAEAVARLDHPNIVPIFEVGRFEDQHYFSMKLIGGESLDKRLENYATDFKGAAKLVATVANAILHAHQRGILHRDLKPANILIDSDGQPHVTDFGLAKRVEGESELTRSGAILGTPAYMAPEQASGRRGSVTTSTDVYGLGAILYALLTASAPFGGDSVIDTLEQVRERSPEPPTKRNPLVPRDLEVICLKCLEKDSRRRYASADALAEDLKHWLAGEPIAARPVGNTARLWMWCRRNKGIAALGCLLIGSLVDGTAFSLAFAVRAKHESTRANTEASRANQEADDARRQRDWSERLRYTAEINLAYRDYESNNVQQARRRLVDVIPSIPGQVDPRGLEWHFLQAQVHQELHVLRAHDRMVESVAFAPNGRLISAESGSGTVRIWDAETGRELSTLHEREGSVSPPVFTPDRRRVAFANSDGTVRIWDAETGHELTALRVAKVDFYQLHFAPHGLHLASIGADRTVRIWDTMSGREVAWLTGHEGTVEGVAFARDGRRLASAARDGTVRVWDVETGHELARLLGHEGWVECVAFSPDGRRIASAGWDSTVRLWDAQIDQEVMATDDSLEWIRSVAFAPNGRIIAASGNRKVRLRDSETRKERAILYGN